MDFRTYMESRSLSPAGAAQKIKSGDRVVAGHFCGNPIVLLNALVDRVAADPEALVNVEICHMVTPDECRYCEPQYEKNFRFNGFFLSGSNRKAVAEGRADYTPVFFHQIPELVCSPDFPVNVAAVVVSPPNEAGYVSFGISVDYTAHAARSAQTVIAEINSNMPFVGNDAAVMKVTDIDWFIPSDRPLVQPQPTKIGPVEKAIGNHAASLVTDGACLQLGIGAIPDAVLGFLEDKKDLGIHSELISNGVMDMVEKGVITCARKNLHKGKITVALAIGTDVFYKWLNNNPMVEGHPVDYINDPRVIGQIDNVVSINSALSVDLLGQVAADCMGSQQFSGVGGQVDFVRGSRFSKGGLSIIALPSTAAKGTVSRIRATLEPGQPVTTSRYDVDYVVTDHGIAALRGKTAADRAKALIGVSAPEFREDLARQAREIYGFRL